MKKQTTLLAAGLIALMGMTGCDKTGKNTQNDNTPGQEQTGENSPKTIELDSTTFSQADSLLDMELTALLPSGNDAASKAMRDTLIDVLHRQMAGWFCGEENVPRKPRKAKEVKAYAKKCYAKMHEQVEEEIEEWDMPFGLPYQWQFSICLQHQTDRYITFNARGYNYSGGAHGMVIGRGVITFSKTDGRPFTRWFKDPDNAQLHEMLLDGIAQYFSDGLGESVTPATLAGCLLVDPAEVELPAEAPRPTGEGLEFTYQQYEIAPYAAGMPAFTLTYDELKPYLTDEAKALLGL